ncbi:hypothetical protein CGJ57_08745 [Vibrio parahaemolyticus]|uniref:hypothetical protein n=1 Tax=Vibrio parahaemolyticus TaxID=670 RepID=UPI00111CA051|nr:hypothetical protein [Vibrio parahaemolyticus]TOD77813.1 hypothetical protein CGJ57_08745 [Vibrio parahaemolyticus]
MNFHINRVADSTWLELHINGNVIMRDELAKDYEAQIQDMKSRLEYIVKVEQRKNVHKLVADHLLNNDLTRFFA